MASIRVALARTSSGVFAKATPPIPARPVCPGLNLDYDFGAVLAAKFLRRSDRFFWV